MLCITDLSANALQTYFEAYFFSELTFMQAHAQLQSIYRLYINGETGNLYGFDNQSQLPQDEFVKKSLPS
jgi:hypothetical protein